MNSDLERYLEKPYTIIVEKHEDGDKPYYAARVLEFEGCITTGDTIEEAVSDIRDAMREWIGANLKLGKRIPEPLRARHYSGKIVVRMPASLHESLMSDAAREGVSLNQYVVASLSRSAWHRDSEHAETKPPAPRNRHKVPAP